MTSIVTKHWDRLQEQKPVHPSPDRSNGHSRPLTISRTMLKGKSYEEVQQMLADGNLLLVPYNGRYTGTKQFK
jgi:hypothetical protein